MQHNSTTQPGDKLTDSFSSENLHCMLSGVVQLLNAICVNYVEHSHAVEPHYTTGANWPLKVEGSWLNSQQKWIILLMLSSILAVVQKSIRATRMSVSQTCEYVYRSAHPNEEKALWRFVHVCLSHTSCADGRWWDADKEHAVYFVNMFFYTALKPMAALWLANANLGKAGLPWAIPSTMLIKGLACRSARCASNPVDHGWILLSTA